MIKTKANTYLIGEKSIITLFEANVASNPQNIAVIYEDEEITYFELNARANQLARYLQQKGVGPDVLVPLCAERNIAMIVGLLAILKAGGAYVPIDPAYPADRILFMLDDTKAPLLVCSKASKSKLQHLENTILVEIDGEDEITINSCSNKNLNLIPAENQLAYMIYTSGSTGKPKGVMIEHRNAAAFLQWCKQEFSPDSFDVLYAVTSICFDLSVFELFYPLSEGKKLRLLENGLSIKNYLDQDTRVLLNTVPSVVKLLLHENANLTHVTILNMAGEPVPLQLVNELDTNNIEVRNLYGPTEDTTYSTVYRLHKGEPVLIGKPIDNTTVYIIKDNTLTAEGEAGEICIGGAGLARGYFNRPELTAEKFVLNPFNQEGSGRMYKTGDWGKWLPDGNIEYLGRIDDQVKIRGYRIELGEIETVLNQFEQVKQAVVIARDNEQEEKLLIGYYIPDIKEVAEKERELYMQQVETWKNVYETEYDNAVDIENIDPEFNISGWKNSFTGNAIPHEQMHEWLDEIVKVIDPQKAGSVLEIGCGTGLIFYKLAGKIQKYYGIDFSQSSINQIRSRIKKGLRDYGKSDFWVSTAHDINLPPAANVDTILLNSVCQYFPGEEYMNNVLAKCMSLLKGKGRIIIGDVRDVRLLQLFKSRLQQQKLESTVTLQELQWAVEQEELREEELCFSPEYFYNLKSVYPEITHIDIHWKSVGSENEMSLYRFTAVIYVNLQKEFIAPQWQEWSAGAHQLATRQLNEGQQLIAIKHAPNPHLWKEKIIDHAIEQQTFKNLGELNKAVVIKSEETERLHHLLTIAVENGYQYRLLVSEDKLKTNLLLYKTTPNGFIINPDFEKHIYQSSKFTNIPLFTDICASIKKEIRASLKKELPDYMVPQDFIALKNFPLTSNGKTDRRFLSAQKDNLMPTKTDHMPANTVLEQNLIDIWQDLLGKERIGIFDNFFELGGHSLLGMRLMSVIRKKLNIDMSIKDLLSYPTVSGLAACLQTDKKQKSHLLIPIKESGSKLPLYIVCGSGGTVFMFREFASLLDDDQPVYGLQQPSLEEQVDTFPDTIEGIAAKYIEEIRIKNPVGPYALSGHCLGGIIAFEMARQLVAAGNIVTYVAIFDTVIEEKQIHPHLNNIAYRLSNKFKYIVSNIWVKFKFEFFLLTKHPRLALNYKIEKARLMMGYDKNKFEYIDAFNSMTAIYEKAADNYQMKPYTGNITIFYATEHYYFMDRQNNVTYNEIKYSTETKNAWKKYARSVQIHDVEGEHSFMFETVHAAELARLLQNQLNNSSEFLIKLAMYTMISFKWLSTINHFLENQLIDSFL